REVLGPPLAGGIEAQLTVQLLPAVRTAPFPIPLQDPLEAAEGELEDPRRDAAAEDVEDFVEQQDEQAGVRVNGGGPTRCRRLHDHVHSELATQDCRGTVQVPLVGAECKEGGLALSIRAALRKEESEEPEQVVRERERRRQRDVGPGGVHAEACIGRDLESKPLDHGERYRPGALVLSAGGA